MRVCAFPVKRLATVDDLTRSESGIVGRRVAVRSLGRAPDASTRSLERPSAKTVARRGYGLEHYGEWALMEKGA